MKHIDTAVLLAAGRGSRLRPYTDAIPKPLLPWKGEPALASILDSVADTGIKQTVLVTRYLSEQIDDFLAGNSGRWSMDIKCCQQTDLAGTADAVQSAVDECPGWFQSTFLVSATDYLVARPFYPEFADFHRSHDCDLSISLKKIPVDQLALRSSVRFSSDFNITEVVEKPTPGQEPSHYSANLLYVLPSSILQDLKAVQPSLRGEKELQTAVNCWLTRHGPARGLLQETPLEWSPNLTDL